MEKIESTIRELVSKTLENEDVDFQVISSNEDLSTYGFNSISAMELVVAIEEEFDLMVEDDDLIIENLNTIDKLIVLLSKYITQKV